MWNTALLDLVPTDTWQWRGHMEMIIWIGLVIYTSIAAWIDFRERRIPNRWTTLWLVLFLWIHFENRTFESALLGFVLIAALMFVPTLLGVWGQGDWKMAMVCGAAIGAFSTLVVWFISFLFVPLLKPFMYRASLRHLAEGQARSIPVAVPVFSAVSVLFVLLCFFNKM